MESLAKKRLTLAAIDRLREKLEKLNKRAERLGLEKLTLTVGPEIPVTLESETGLTRTVMTADAEVAGYVPRINGWEVVARVEFTDYGNLVHVAPHIDNIDSKYRSIDATCEHCNTNRKRNDIVVIRDCNGNEKRVGRNCLADFVRTEDAEGLLAYASWTNELAVSDCDEDTDFRGGRVKPVESPLTILEAASVCIRKLGWVSGSAAYDTGRTSTKSNVFELLYPPTNRTAFDGWKEWVRKNDLKVSEFDKDRATKTLEWLKSLEPGKSEYLHNLNLLAKMDYVGLDKFGYIVSAIVAYEKEFNKNIEKPASKGNNVYFGKIKERVKSLNVDCVGVWSFDGNFGVTTIVRFEHRISDTEYAVLVWFASGDKTEDFEAGKSYTVDATIVNHEESDKYGKSTKVNRVTVK